MSYVDRIARLRIELNDIKPAIWRTVEVPLTMSLTGLHQVIQAAMPFEDYHLFAFIIGERRYALPDPEWPDPNTRNARTTKLGKMLDLEGEAFTYVYDFGDDWHHTVTVESVGAADPSTEYPRFLDGARRAPPEDVGGWPGYEEFLEALGKPRHPERKRMLEWCGGSFDPEVMPLETITERIGKLARRRTLGKAAFARSQGPTQ